MNKIGIRKGLIISAMLCMVCAIMMKIGEPRFPKPMQDNFTNPIMALEFVQTNNDLDTILSFQTGNAGDIESRANYLIRALQWDFPFIIGYGLLLFFLVLRLTKRDWFRTFMLILFIAVVISDVLENVYSLKILEGYSPGQDLSHLISWQYKFVLTKWLLLFILVWVLILKELRKRLILAVVGGLIYGVLFVFFFNNPFHKTPLLSNITELLSSLTFLIIIVLTLNQIFARNKL